MGKFENDIEQQLSSFRLEPSPQVWNDIETAIQQRRRRRAIAWWWFPLLGLVVGTAGWGLWQYTGYKNDSHKVAVSTNSKHAVTEIAQPVSTARQSATTVDAQDLSPNEAVSLSGSDVTHLASPNNNSTADCTQAGHTITLAAAHKYQRPAHAQTSLTGSYRQQAATTAFVYDADKTVRIQERYVLPTSATTKWLQQPLVRIAPKSLFTMNCRQLLLATIPPQSNKAKEQQTPVVKQSGKGRWYITMGGGSSIIAGKPLVQQPDLFNIAPGGIGSSGPSLAGGGSQPKTYAKPSAGYFLTAGLGYQHALTQHIQLFTGLSYRYLANNTDTGKTVKNHQHSLQIPVGMQYTFNPQAKWKISAFGGGAVTWHVQQKWLATDEANGYHYNSRLNQKINTSLFAGVAITNARGWRVSVQWEQGLQTLQQAPSQPYRSQLAGLHLGLPLR